MEKKLYKINKEIQDIINIEDDFAREAALSNCKLSLEAKVSELAMEIKESEMYVSGIDEAIDRLKKQKEWFINHKETIEEDIIKSMQNNGMKKVIFNNFIISLGKTPPAVNIENELLIPDEYWKTKEIRTIDKIKIKQVLKNGEEIEGVILTQSDKLNIK